MLKGVRPAGGVGGLPLPAATALRVAVGAPELLPY